MENVISFKGNLRGVVKENIKVVINRKKKIRITYVIDKYGKAVSVMSVRGLVTGKYYTVSCKEEASILKGINKYYCYDPTNKFINEHPILTGVITTAVGGGLGLLTNLIYDGKLPL